MPTYTKIKKLNGGMIELEFNDLENHEDVLLKSMTLESRSTICTIYHEINNGLTVLMNNGRQFTICSKNDLVPGYVVIESVNDVEPTTNENLKTLLQAGL